MLKIMFLCTGNTCRSQIAEGFARELGKGIITPFSAGTQQAGIVNPYAIAVMKEVGVDISRQTSKNIAASLMNNMDMIITLCAKSESSCPMSSPDVKRLQWTIDDPVQAKGTETEILDEFRKTRDEIWARVLELVHSLQAQGK